MYLVQEFMLVFLMGFTNIHIKLINKSIECLVYWGNAIVTKTYK